jgi:hypothetical protein
MLVLLALAAAGHAPLEIALLFLFYEAFGIATNLVAGWAGARWGLQATLLGGLALETLALGLLALRAGALDVPSLLAVQALSGVAKDLTKASSKSYAKVLAPAGDAAGLLRGVTLLTGSKNALKGVGFFAGGALLSALGLRGAALALAGLVLLALLGAGVRLPRAAGRTAVRPSLASLVPPPGPVRWLSASRLFLFGARDAWFVLALPLWLGAVAGLSPGGVGASLAAWVVGYGAVQTLAPAWTGRGGGPDARRLLAWTLASAVPLAGLLAGLALPVPPLAVVALCLAAFAAAFATTSAVHSYLIVAYAEGDRVALRVGFYYGANAAGRLLGTVLSGFLFQAAGQGTPGLLACVGAGLALALLAAGFSVPLRRAEPLARGA